MYNHAMMGLTDIFVHDPLSSLGRNTIIHTHPIADNKLPVKLGAYAICKHTHKHTHIHIRKHTHVMHTGYAEQERMQLAHTHTIHVFVFNLLVWLGTAKNIHVVRVHILHSTTL